MKKFKKLLCLVLSGILLFSGMGTAFPVFAENEGNNETADGYPLKIEVKTDKDSYSETCVATFNVTVTNVSNEIVENVSAEVLFDGLTPYGKNTITKETSSLAPNESMSFSYRATIDESKFELNFFQKIWFFFIRLFSIFTGVTTVKDDNGFNDGREYIEDTKTVNFGKLNAKNTVRIWYENTGIIETDLITIDQNDFTTTDVLQILTGKIKLQEEIKRLYFTQEWHSSETEIDEYEITIFGNETWQTDEFFLIPENNKIIIFAETESDIYSSKPINIYYDRGESYEPKITNISYDNEENNYYINNIIIIDFVKGVREERKNEIVTSIGGKVVGRINTIDEFQVEINKRTLKELEELCEYLCTLDEVLYAHTDFVYDMSDESSVNNNYYLSNVRDELQAIDIEGAWQYDDYFKNIRIGVIDSGFDTNHPNLNIKFPSEKEKNRNKPGNHGTHVAGIIASKKNDNENVMGIVRKAELYCVNYQLSALELLLQSSESKVYDSLIQLVEKNSKIINISSGKATDTQKQKDNFGKICSEKMSALLQRGYDFLIVTAAGNDAKDAGNDGYFKSITKENCFISGGISADDIINRIIVVASCFSNNSNNKYALMSDSNGGERIDIVAPGYVYSTLAGIKDDKNGIVSGQKYGYLRGTSMASPMVASVAGLVWSINKNFNGAMVKDIVCNSYDKGVEVIDYSGKYGPYRILNAKLAVEKALKKIGVYIDDGTVIPMVSAGGYHTVGLKSDSTVVAVGDNARGQCNVTEWNSIVAVSAYGGSLTSNHTVGLKKDGTVVAVGSNGYGQCNVSSWNDITAVSAGAMNTYGLKKDGTVVAVGDNWDGKLDVFGWYNIIAISAGGDRTAGLKKDGTVVTVGDAYAGDTKPDVSSWVNIDAISAGGSHIVGLKKDGTVVATGYNGYGQCNVSGWNDIIAVSAGLEHTVGLKKDGTVLATGLNNYGECNISGWNNIISISAEYFQTVGLKRDGTVVAVGDNYYGQCNVSGWNLGASS